MYNQDVYDFTNTLLCEQGLVQWPAVSSMEEMGFLWSHEMKRSFMDGICRDADSQWLQGFIDSVSKQVCMYMYECMCGYACMSVVCVGMHV